MTVHFAWRTLRDPLVLRVTEVSLDGLAVDAVAIDEDHLRVDIEAARDWSHLELLVEATPGGEVPDELGDASAYVMVECGATHTRIPVELSGQPWTGKIGLTREEVDKRFVLRAELAAEVGDRLRIVGASAEWTVVMERSVAPVPPGLPPFETVWVDFTSSDAPATVRATPEAHAYMDLEGTPRLLLNSGIDGFQHLLHARAPKLERRRLQDLLGAEVARYALRTLFRAAAAEVRDGDGVVSPPEVALQRQVCEAVAERTPGIGSVEELYERLIRARDSVKETIELWGAVDLAIDALTGVSGALGTACAEVKHG